MKEMSWDEYYASFYDWSLSTQKSYSEKEHEFIEPQPKRPGFFATLFVVIAGVSMAGDSKQKKHNGRYNDDGANCPPHYCYRYGRWYYGHDHVHGCQFGGNRGSGSMD